MTNLLYQLIQWPQQLLAHDQMALLKTSNDSLLQINARLQRMEIVLVVASLLLILSVIYGIVRTVGRVDASNGNR